MRTTRYLIIRSLIRFFFWTALLCAVWFLALIAPQLAFGLRPY